MIQSKFLRFIKYREEKVYPKFNPYSELVSQFNIEKTEEKFNLNLMSTLYKIANNKIDSMGLVSALQYHVPQMRSRPKPGLFHVPKSRTNYVNISPMWKMGKTYNEVVANDPSVDINSLSFQSFKRVLRAQWRKG